MIRKVGHYRFLESFDLPFESQIVACVGIKALLGEPKIRNAISAHNEGETGQREEFFKNPGTDELSGSCPRFCLIRREGGATL